MLQMQNEKFESMSRETQDLREEVSYLKANISRLQGYPQRFPTPRILWNRESARRSRERKQAHLDDLHARLTGLRVVNSSLQRRLSDVYQKFIEVAFDNRMLKAETETLRERVCWCILCYVDLRSNPNSYFTKTPTRAKSDVTMVTCQR